MVDLIEVEVETLDELSQALNAGARRIMLDNFSVADMRAAQARSPPQSASRPACRPAGWPAGLRAHVLVLRGTAAISKFIHAAFSPVLSMQPR